MEKTIQLLQAGFESSSDTTPEFKKYASTFNRELKARLQELNAELVAFNRGHFYVSGFFTKAGQYYYFSQSDVRHFPSTDILVRTAQHAKDYSGGTNNRTTLGPDMFDRLLKELKK
jgi:hypothetical protein